MKAFRVPVALATTVLVAACVTINVYFPAAAAQKAADRIIRDVYGPAATGAPAKPSEPESSPAGPQGTPPSAPGAAPQSRVTPPSGTTLSLTSALLNWVVPPARAAADINVQSPAIQRLKASMRARFPRLKPYFDSGAIGMTNNGLLAVRNLNAVPLPKRREVQQLVAAANQDRNALYREIARANGHPEWEQDIRSTFARRWVANAPGGWWYQGSGGSWQRK